ncbi:MAG: hypothetical protein RLZZ162_2719 [Verrucomicrobiota bacterium]|jgi:hypothetical protein
MFVTKPKRSAGVNGCSPLGLSFVASPPFLATEF